jgi:hypothetical protein
VSRAARCRLTLIALGTGLCLVRPVTAQRRPATELELRADAIGARATTAHLGAGLSFPAGTYVRGVLTVAGGAAWKASDSRSSARVDAGLRFLMDPFREQTWALYGTGGLSMLYDGFDRWRPLVLVAVGLEREGPGRWTHAIEVGLGGGARLGLVLRRASAGTR